MVLLSFPRYVMLTLSVRPAGPTAIASDRRTAPADGPAGCVAPRSEHATSAAIDAAAKPRMKLREIDDMPRTAP